MMLQVFIIAIAAFTSGAAISATLYAMTKKPFLYRISVILLLLAIVAELAHIIDMMTVAFGL